MATKKKSDVKTNESSEEQKETSKTSEAEESFEAEAAEEKTTAAKTSESDASTDKKKPTQKEADESSETSEKAEKTPGEEKLSEEERKRLSEKAQKRYRQLAKARKEAEQRAEKLEGEVRQLRDNQENRFLGDAKPSYLKELGVQSSSASSQADPGQKSSRLPYETSGEGSTSSDTSASGEERVITVDDYKRDVLQTADIVVQARLKQFAKANEIQSDLQKLESKYEELNPESDSYSEELSVKLSKLFNAQLKAEPRVKLETFVDDIMALRKGGEEKGKAEVTAKVVEQKAEEAISPSEVAPPPETSFEDMTLKEKESYMKEHGLW